MGSKKPMPGRCGSPTARRAGFCTHLPVEGRRRCRLHGGLQEAPKVARHFLRGLTDPEQEEIEALVRGEELLDPKRTVAAHALLLREAVVLPREEDVDRWACVLAGRRGKTAEVTELDREVARSRLARNTSAMLAAHQGLQVDAAKAQELRDVLREEMLPHIRGFAEACLHVIRRFVPADQREEAAATIHQHMDRAVADAAINLREAATRHGRA